MRALGTSISTWHKWDMDTDDQGAQAPHWYSDWDTQFPELSVLHRMDLTQC